MSLGSLMEKIGSKFFKRSEEAKIVEAPKRVEVRKERTVEEIATEQREALKGEIKKLSAEIYSLAFDIAVSNNRTIKCGEFQAEEISVVIERDYNPNEALELIGKGELYDLVNAKAGLEKSPRLRNKEYKRESLERGVGAVIVHPESEDVVAIYVEKYWPELRETDETAFFVQVMRDNEDMKKTFVGNLVTYGVSGIIKRQNLGQHAYPQRKYVGQERFPSELSNADSELVAKIIKNLNRSSLMRDNQRFQDYTKKLLEGQPHQKIQYYLGK